MTSTIALVAGDPAGVGPELVAKLLGDPAKLPAQIRLIAHRASLEAAAKVVLSGDGKRITNEFQDVIRDMEQEELRLLALRDASAKRPHRAAHFLLAKNFPAN